MILPALLLTATAWAGPAQKAIEAVDARDYKAAVRIASDCAKAGDAECMYVLSQLYQDGLGLPQDDKLAYQWRYASASKGFPDAQMMLARSYETGTGTPKDPKKAKEWYKRAAASLKKLGEKNDTKAQVNLGAMYDEGIGVEKDPKEAAKWYAAAALQGVQSAQINIAEMLIDGRGVPADPVKAASWLMLASDGGETDRWREVYAKVEPKLSPAQVNQAEADAAKLKLVVRTISQ